MAPKYCNEELATESTVLSKGLNFWSLGGGGSRPDVDIVAVQGLQAKPWKTWVSKQNGSEDTSEQVMWLRDLLPETCPNARIASFSYTSGIKAHQTDIYGAANELLMQLQQCRRSSAQNRPLVLIGHSLGGLVIQQAMISAIAQPTFTDIHKSTVGIVFLGSPFAGSDVAKSTWYTQFISKGLGYDQDLIELLSKGNRFSYDRLRDFEGAAKEIDVVCFYEEEATPYLRGILSNGPTVDLTSATVSSRRMMCLNTNHSGMNKFGGRDDKNFQKVASEIQRMAEDAQEVVYRRFDLKGEPSALTKFWRVPSGTSGMFTGRCDVLKEIKTALFSDRDSRKKRFVITGLGGMGKSEICKKFIEETAHQYGVVAWVDLSDESLAEKSLIELSEHLGKPASNLEEAQNFLAEPSQKRLVVLDNADNPNTNYSRFFPIGPNWHVLVTSRNRDLRQYNPKGHRELDALGLDDAVDLLLSAALIDEKDRPSSRGLAADVADTLSMHTLALVHAGNYVASGLCSLSQYTAEFNGTDVDKRLKMLDCGSRLEMSRHHSVLATFEVSAAALESSQRSEDLDAMRLLQTLSVMHHSQFPTLIFEDAWHGAREIMERRTVRGNASWKSFYRMARTWNAQAAKTFVSNIIPPGPSKQHAHQVITKFLPQVSDRWRPQRLHKAVSRLSSLALIKSVISSDGPTMLSVHPLVHTWARDRQTTASQQESWMSAGSVIVLSNKALWTNLSAWTTRENPSASTWMKWASQLMPHVRSFAANRSMSNVSSLKAKASDMISIRAARERLHRKSMTMEAYIFCAKLLQMMREDAIAKTLIDHASERLYNDAEYFTTELILLAKTKAANMLNRGDFDGALIQYRQIGHMERFWLPKGHPAWLNSQRGVAQAFNESGEPAKAAKILEDVVDAQKRALDESDLSLLTSQHELARNYRFMDRSDKAIVLLKHVIALKDQTLHEETHLERLKSRRELALACLVTGQIDESVKLLRRVVDLEEMTLTAENPERLESQHALALAYRRAGRMTEAVKLLEQVVALEQENFEATNPQRLWTQYDLARMYRECGKCKVAVVLLNKIGVIRENQKFIMNRFGYLSWCLEYSLASLGDGQFDLAMEMMSEVIEEQPNFVSGTAQKDFLGLEWGCEPRTVPNTFKAINDVLQDFEIATSKHDEEGDEQAKRHKKWLARTRELVTILHDVQIERNELNDAPPSHVNEPNPDLSTETPDPLPIADSELQAKIEAEVEAEAEAQALPEAEVLRTPELVSDQGDSPQCDSPLKQRPPNERSWGSWSDWFQSYPSLESLKSPWNASDGEWS